MPAATLSLEDLFLLVFVTVDDLYRALVPETIRHRSQHHRIAFSDSEVLTLSLMQEALGLDSEASFHHFVSTNYRHLFPQLISRDRYHRRRKALAGVHLVLFRHLADRLAETARYLIVDSAPIETVAFARSKSGQASIAQARFGYTASKKRFFFGLRLHALVSDTGAVFDFVVTAADTGEREAVEALMQRATSPALLADNGYSGVAFAHAIERHGTNLAVLPRPSQRAATEAEARRRRWLRRKRALIETVFSMLADQFTLETTRARSIGGVALRVAAKLSAFNLSLVLNTLLGRPMLAVKSLYL